MTWKRPTAWWPAGRGGSAPVDVAAAAAADALVAAGAERVGSLAGEDHDADVQVLARARERVDQLDHGLRAERVADLGPVDRDLRDAGVLAGRELVADVGVLRGRWLPGHSLTRALRLPFRLWITGSSWRPPSTRTATALEDADGAVADLHGRGRARCVERGRRAGERGSRSRCRCRPAEFVAALHGCLLRGAVAVPIDLRLSAAERATRAAGAAVVVGEPLAGRAGRIVREPLSLESTATRDAHLGHDRGAPAGRADVRQLARERARLGGRARARPEERWLCPMPLVHVGGLSILIRSAIYGTTVVLHERFEPRPCCAR